MEEAAEVRRAAREAVRDVEPDRLRTELVARLGEQSLAPGVLTLRTARVTADREELPGGLLELAAGVQLVYEGLRLTRALAYDVPWARGDRDAGDVEVLVADVLVSRGFFLLARTDAARPAVSMVRTFGRDQTRHMTAGEDGTADPALEIDSLELALITGVVGTGRPLPDDARPFARALVESEPDGGRLPSLPTLRAEATRDRLDRAVVASEGEVHTPSE